MSRTCEICGKGPVRANHVSHSQVKVPRQQKPNLQQMTVDGAKVKACSTCRRTVFKSAK